MEDSVTIEASNQKHCSYIIIAAVGKPAYITIMCMDVHVGTAVTVPWSDWQHKTLVMKKLCN